MTWAELVVPALVIALGVRVEAVLLGPYWSWVEMFPEASAETPRVARKRRAALFRRVAIPGVVGFVAVAMFSDRFTPSEMALVGLAGAGLLLWPIVFHGLPYGTRARDWELLGVYSLLVASFSVSAWTGAVASGWARDVAGGVGNFLLDNLFSFLLGSVVVLFLTGAQDRLTARESQRRDERLER